MTWTDDGGHTWPDGTPDDGDRCRRCGVAYEDMPGFAEVCQPKLAATQAAGSSPGAEHRWAEIEKWLRITFEQDLQRLGPKAIEYGSADLQVMGKAMESLLPGGGDLDVDSREAAGLEMAIGFYALGKAARLYGAWEKGREPSEDTWHDLGVYALMARYVREHGRWF